MPWDIETSVPVNEDEGDDDVVTFCSSCTTPAELSAVLGFDWQAGGLCVRKPSVEVDFGGTLTAAVDDV